MSSKNSLMASLMGDGPEQDLFGDVPLDSAVGEDQPPPPFSTSTQGPTHGTMQVPSQSPPYSQNVGTLGEVAAMGNATDTASAPPAQPPATLSATSATTDNLPTVPSAAPVAAAPASAPVAAPPSSTSTPVTTTTNNTSNNNNNNNNNDKPSTFSLMAQSGLLSAPADASGMFDAVDQEEEQQQQQQQRLKEEEAARQQQLHQQQQQQQQQQQAAYGYASQQQQAQLQAGMQNLTVSTTFPAPVDPNMGFYREHPHQPSVASSPAQNYNYSSGAAPAGMHNSYNQANNNYYYGTQQPHPQPTYQQPQNTPTYPSITAGMHNAMPPRPGFMPPSTQQQHPQQQPNYLPGNLGQLHQIQLQKPQDVPPLYTSVTVSEPMLIQQQSFLINSTPYWSYQIATVLANNQGTWLVRRRFKHVVAMEDRLRQACPGSILPPRPDKHATRALEEATAQQSAEFAMQRAREMQQYLNALIKHPVAGQSQVLRLFLGLQDDIGTAWPEVSGNAFTKIGAVAAGMSIKVAETTQLTAGSAPVHEWEDNAELLQLCSSENLRMGAVSQAVPKLEGTVSLLREEGDAAGAVGMELAKMTKQNNAIAGFADDFKACEVLSNGLLRHGRRTKRLALEMSAAMDSFLQQYKLVRYEKMAMQDRRHAIQRKGNYRRGADQRALFLAQQQRQLQATGQYGQLNQLQNQAIHHDHLASELHGEAEEIAARLKSEIHRVAIDRRTQWNSSMKTIASSMKEACTERLAIWEATLETLQTTPGCMPEDTATAQLEQQQQPQHAGGIPSHVHMSAPASASHGGGSAMFASNPAPNGGLDNSTIYA